MPENIAELGFGLHVTANQQPIDSLVDAVGRFETVITKVMEHIPELGAELETEMAAVRTRIDEAAAGTKLERFRAEQEWTQGLGKDYLGMAKNIHTTAMSINELTNQAQQSDQAIRDASSGLDIFNAGTDAFNDQLKVLEQLEKKHKKFSEQIEFAKNNHPGLYDEIKRGAEKLEEYRKQLLDGKEATFGFIRGVNKTSKVLSNLGIELYGVDTAVMKMAAGLGFWNSILHLVMNALKDVIALQDDYAKTSFEAAGGVNAMLDANAELQGRIGLTAQEASESVKALAAAGVRSEEDFSKAAVSMVKFTQATGASAGATAQFAKTAIVALGSAEEMEDTLGDLTGAMVAGGLSSEDMNSVLGILNKRLIGVSGAYGADRAKEFASTMGLAAAQAKALGISSENLTSILEDLRSPVAALESDMMVLYARAGVLQGALSGNLKPGEAFNKTMQQMATDMSGLGDKLEIGEQMKLQAIWGKSADEVTELFGAFQDADGSAEKFLAKQQDIKDTADENAKLNEKWADATNTLAKEFKQAVLPLIGLISKGLVPFVEIVTFALKPISLMVDAFGLISDVFKELGKVMEVTNETGKAWNTVLKTLGVSLILFMSPLGMAGAAFFAIAGATKALIEWFGITDDTTKKVISVFGLLAGAATALYIKNITLGLSFKGLLSWMNPMRLVKWVAGLWKTKAATAGVTAATQGMTAANKAAASTGSGLKSMANPKTILAIGALLLMLGGFVYILGQTAVALKKAGVSMKEFAGFMAVVVIGVGILATVLVALAVVAGPVAPVLLAIGAAMLMIGAAVGIAAAGIGYMARGFATLFESLSFERVAMFGAFAGTLYMAAGGFVALGASMLAVPAIIAGMAALSAAYLVFAAASRSLKWIVPVLNDLASAALGIRVLSAALVDMGIGLKMVTSAIRSMEGGDMKGLDNLTQGILQRRKAIIDSADLIETQAQRVSAAVEMINNAKIAVAEGGPGDVADTAALRRTVVGEQVVQVRNITGDVDRLRNQRDQEATVGRLDQLVSTMSHISSKLDQSTPYEIGQLLEEWLPQIAQDDRSSFRNESSNNWMGGR